jgi:hypothetical protein
MPQYVKILIVHPGCSQIRQSTQELVFTLFRGDQNALVDYFGIGRVSGLLASKGMFNPACLPAPSPDTRTSMTDPMTEEEEEKEFQKVMECIDRMAQSGLVCQGLE